MRANCVGTAYPGEGQLLKCGTSRAESREREVGSHLGRAGGDGGGVGHLSPPPKKNRQRKCRKKNPLQKKNLGREINHQQK